MTSPQLNIILSGGQSKAFPLRSGAGQAWPLSTPVQHNPGKARQSNQARMKTKGNLIEKEGVKLSLFLEDIYKKPEIIHQEKKM